jgi:tRNA threonylcarbamoyladenosine biosynthesis protein TsaE
VVLPFAKIVENENETSLIAAEFSRLLNGGGVVCLNGNLGSGKTFFVKSVCKYFEIDSASSPSFSIANEYSGKQNLIHLDFYRLKKVEELYDIGFEDYLLTSNSIVFIEWSDMFPEILPKKHFRIDFSIMNESQRKIKITKHE